MLDPSAYTLTNGGGGGAGGHDGRSRSGSRASPLGSPGPGGGAGAGARPPPPRVSDSRWKFQDEGLFPKPREFGGGVKRYRAGRGSSVPLNLGAF
ncbi:hypothetical protein BDY21DRAFT_333275, partial [Lineolata rhizophorae]